MKKCFSKRHHAYKKCNDCKDILTCSIKTLARKFRGKYSIVSRYGRVKQ